MTQNQRLCYSALIVIFSFLLLLSASVIWNELRSRQNDKNEFQNLQNRIETFAPAAKAEETETDINPPAETEPVSPEDTAAEAEPEFVRNLTPLFEENSDCVGWISIADTTVDYPVMHTPEEPEKYLRLNFYKEFSYSGVPFIDARCSLDSDNLFIYGHNMKNGTMFSDIINYGTYEYFLAHPVIELETAAGWREYMVCAVMYTDTADPWFTFVNAEDEDDFNERMAYLQKKALYDTGITPVYGQSFITLSTCDNTNDDIRFLVIAVAED